MVRQRSRATRAVAGCRQLRRGDHRGGALAPLVGSGLLTLMRAPRLEKSYRRVPASMRAARATPGRRVVMWCLCG